MTGSAWACRSPPSRRLPFVAVVQPAHLRNRNDLASSHDRARFRSVLRQRQVCPRLVVIREITLQEMAEVPSTEDHHIVQTLTSNRANQPFHECILPRTPRCGDYFLHSQQSDATVKFLATDRVTITDQVMLGIPFSEGF